MTDYISSAIAAFEHRHGSKPTQVVVGLEAGIVLAKDRQLFPEVSGVKVVTRPLNVSERPVEPGTGTRLYVSYAWLGGLGVCELA